MARNSIGQGVLNNTVLLRNCETYDRETIYRLIREGMSELGYWPSGRVFVKPNVVFSNPHLHKFGRTAYTNPALVGSALLALSHTPGVRRVDLGENSAVGIPTRYAYTCAGFYQEMKAVKTRARAPVDIFCIDEEMRDRVFLGGKVHDTLRVARKMARADSMVYLPKLKCHCVSTITNAVKLNIGICSDDERSIRHDFLLNDKIVDLLSVGWPDFIVTDAIDVGVGNEAFPVPRRLGLLIMGRNPMAVDIVAARLLGYVMDDVPYLKRAVERGYGPAGLSEITLRGDITTVDGLDARAERIRPYDDEYTRWQDLPKELTRLGSPLRFYWGSYRRNAKEKCGTGCLMGLKMFLGFIEHYAGAAAFPKGKPAVLVIGRVEEPIDARGQDVFLIGTCASAPVSHAGQIRRLDKCFVTASDMTQFIWPFLGLPFVFKDFKQVGPYAKGLLTAAVMKTIHLRYAQDVANFLYQGLVRKI
ncbi:MAG: DUF362 domain-containing protein [Thermodesulfobacteriota bacterium]